MTTHPKLTDANPAAYTAASEKAMTLQDYSRKVPF
jgi:hypothetical protein